MNLGLLIDKSIAPFVLGWTRTHLSLPSKNPSNKPKCNRLVDCSMEGESNAIFSSLGWDVLSKIQSRIAIVSPRARRCQSCSPTDPDELVDAIIRERTRWLQIKAMTLREANPLHAVTCPVLSLVAACPSHSLEERPLLCLTETACSITSDEIRTLGIEPEKIGVHSVRKGAATYRSSGTTAGVSFATNCVHVGWSMGGAKDRYIKYAEAGDRVCGRTLCCWIRSELNTMD